MIKIQRTCPECGALEAELHASNCSQIGHRLPFIEAVVRGDIGPVALYDTITISIPPEVEQYKEDIRRFVDAMVYKLGQKAHKGKWETYTLQHTMELLRGEEKELTEAIERGNLVEVLLESADVANFALIVSAIAIERGK